MQPPGARTSPPAAPPGQVQGIAHREPMTCSGFDDYQARALDTAFHPPQLAVLYEATGLTGEALEVVEIALGRLVGQPSTATAVSELGDVCWYAAALTHRLGLPLSVVAGTDNLDRFAADARATDDLAALDAEVQLAAGAMQLAVLCGRVLETVKKTARGDDGPALLPLQLSGARTDAVAALVGLAVRRVAVLAELCGTSLTEVCDTNLDKLAARAFRGTLSGEGSTR